MTKDIWLNLPVKDVQRSKAFFTAIGWKFNEARSGGNDMAAMLVGEKDFVVMLFEENMLVSFMQNKLTDTSQSSELMISFSAESRQEVDDMAVKAAAAGANVFSNPAEIQGWMYGFAFADLDGHRWNMLYMDMEKMK